MDAEFWGFVIALCTLGVLYFGGEIVRKPQEADWWASHEFCLACFAIGFYVFLKLVA